MKKFLFLILALTAFNAMSGAIVLHEKEVELPVDIGDTRLKFTNLGYGNIHFVKVIVPELAKETFLNHRNAGEDGPCLFTFDASSVDQVVQNRPEKIESLFNIKLLKRAQVVDGVCQVIMIEDISTNIRGYRFTHTKSLRMPDRVPADCF